MIEYALVTHQIDINKPSNDEEEEFENSINDLARMGYCIKFAYGVVAYEKIHHCAVMEREIIPDKKGGK